MRFWLAISAVLMLVLSSCSSSASAEDLQGSVREPAPTVSSFSLSNATADNSSFPLQAEPGKLLVTFFGFTYCPDICPTTLADTRTAIENMSPEDAERIDMSMVTVDPGRDTGPVLTDYIHKFFPEGIALRTDDTTQLAAIEKAFGATSEVQASDDPAKYEVGHTAWLYAIDDQGRLRIQWSYGTTSDVIQNDLTTLLKIVDQESA